MPNGMTSSAFHNIMRPIDNGIRIGAARLMIGKDLVTKNLGVRVEYPVRSHVNVFAGTSGGPGAGLTNSIGVTGKF